MIRIIGRIQLLISIIVIIPFFGISILSSCSIGKKSCGSQYNEMADTLELCHLKEIKKHNNLRYSIVDTVDLHNKTLKLPKDVLLCFDGGMIRNGSLVGNNTSIKYKGACFSDINVYGTWNIPVISTKMFDNLSKDNDLQKLLAFTNPEIHNDVIIQNGVYYVKSLRNDLECLRVTSNTSIVLNGIIKLRPNDYPSSYIVRITGDNIAISGHGTIVGDKIGHTGKEGEWGMGIFIWSGNNVSIKDLNVKDCWGDCIYVGGGSSDIVIENCHLDNGRRQGISITSTKNIIIKDCEISNVGGTAPGYGIDIEPNSGNSVGNVIIKNIKCINCKGGVLAYGFEKNARIGDVTIEDSYFIGCSKEPVRFYGCSNVSLSDCTIESVIGKETIHKERVVNYKQNHITIH